MRITIERRKKMGKKKKKKMSCRERKIERKAVCARFGNRSDKVEEEREYYKHTLLQKSKINYDK